MKKLHIYYYFCLVSITCFVLTSCDNKKTEIRTTTKQHMDAGVETIKNMKEAYKGEETAIAKY